MLTGVLDIKNRGLHTSALLTHSIEEKVSPEPV
jgi:hypothetical protein